MYNDYHRNDGGIEQLTKQKRSPLASPRRRAFSLRSLGRLGSVCKTSAQPHLVFGVLGSGLTSCIMTLMPETLALSNDHLVFDFPYDAAQVAEIKKIDGAKWDKVSRVWRVPMSSLQQARDFASKYNFHIDNDVLTFTLPDKTVQRTGVYHLDDWLFMSFSYDPVRVRAVKGVPGVTWDAESKAWKAPLTAVRSVIGFAESFGYEVPSEINEMATQIETARTESIAAAKSTSAELDLPSLNGELLP